LGIADLTEEDFESVLLQNEIDSLQPLREDSDALVMVGSLEEALREARGRGDYGTTMETLLDRLLKTHHVSARVQVNLLAFARQKDRELKGVRDRAEELKRRGR